MCQLLGMNNASPTDFRFSLKGFCRRGGETDIHSHGWGMVVYEGRGVRSFHDTLPACQSPIADLVQNYPIRTYNMIAHIRYATQGEVSLENVHPFNRVWKGVQMTFCHNGECPKFSNLGGASAHVEVPLLGQTQPSDVIYHPVGDTDSEAVFCAILNALNVEFPNGLPTLPVLHEFLSDLCHEIVEGHPEQTIFNFLLGCGQYTLFAYSWPGQRPGSTVWNGLYYIVRQPPFTTAKLLDTDYEIDFAAVNAPNNRVAVITTKPLTEEAGWVEMQRGELLMFDKGLPYRTPKCCQLVENEGRGLFSKCVTAAKSCSRSSPSTRKAAAACLPLNSNNNSRKGPQKQTTTASALGGSSPPLLSIDAQASSSSASETTTSSVLSQSVALQTTPPTSSSSSSSAAATTTKTAAGVFSVAATEALAETGSAIAKSLKTVAI